MTKWKPPRRPTDVNQRAKLIVDLLTGEITEEEVAELPPMGREISAQARTEAVSPERRSEIARQAAESRWANQ